MEGLKSYWAIISFVVGLIVLWTTFSTRLTHAEAEIEQLSQVVAQINQINISLAEIKRDINHINEKLK